MGKKHKTKHNNKDSTLFVENIKDRLARLDEREYLLSKKEQYVINRHKELTAMEDRLTTKEKELNLIKGDLQEEDNNILQAPKEHHSYTTSSANTELTDHEGILFKLVTILNYDERIDGQLSSANEVLNFITRKLNDIEWREKVIENKSYSIQIMEKEIEDYKQLIDAKYSTPEEHTPETESDKAPIYAGHAHAGLCFSESAEILKWLREISDIYSLDWPGDIVTTGSVPFSEDFMDIVLRNHGHNVYSTNVESSIVIVGREDFNLENLRSQIEIRKGKQLKIYSQEMAVLAIFTGNDPFDSPKEVLLEMGKGHPVLEHLMSNGFEWPSLAISSESSEEYIEIDGSLWRPDSPLTAMGYHTGKTSNLSDHLRKAKLSKIFSGRLRFPDSFAAHEKEEWGTPSSLVRLEKIAKHIVWNIKRFSSRDGYEQAVDEWESDLGYLKKKFYKKNRFFVWPFI